MLNVDFAGEDVSLVSLPKGSCHLSRRLVTVIEEQTVFGAPICHEVSNSLLPLEIVLFNSLDNKYINKDVRLQHYVPSDKAWLGAAH